MKKAISGLLMIMVLLLCLNGSAYGDEPLSLHMEGYTIKSNVMDIYINTNLVAPPTTDELTISVGNTSLPIKEIKKFSAAGQGISFIFLADISGSISPTKLQNIKDTLNAITEQMSDLDNASVLTVGNEAYTRPFVSDKQQLKEQISSINGSSEDTNLYSGIVKALDMLTTSDSCAPKKCLVILSDGEDYAVRGITREEVDAKIARSHIPIYTVSITGANPQEKYIQTSKILGSFARLSPGGIDYIHQLNRDSCTEIAADIKSSLNKSLILTADLTGFQSEGNEIFMKIDLAVAGRGKTSDGYPIVTTGLTPHAPAKESFLAILWLILGTSAIIIATAIIIILKKRNKSASYSAPQPDLQVQASVSEDNQSSINSEVQRNDPLAELIQIRLTKIGLIEEEIFHLEVSDELVIGRVPSKATLSFPNDDLLSARHCVIGYESGSFNLRDLGSTNGTYVNGVPINRPFKLAQDDIILIGSVELRINW